MTLEQIVAEETNGVERWSMDYDDDRPPECANCEGNAFDGDYCTDCPVRVRFDSGESWE